MKPSESTYRIAMLVRSSERYLTDSYVRLLVDQVLTRSVRPSVIPADVHAATSGR